MSKAPVSRSTEVVYGRFLKKCHGVQRVRKRIKVYHILLVREMYKLHIFNQQKLFRDFFQIRPDKDGSGLGLAICKKIAIRHQGDLIVHQSSDQGTIFKLTLPINLAVK